MSAVPIPTGDPGAIRSTAQRLAAVASEIDSAASAVGGVSGGAGSWQGQAAAGFRAAVAGQKTQLTSAAQTFQTAAACLAAFAAALENAQNQCRAAAANIAKASANPNITSSNADTAKALAEVARVDRLSAEVATTALAQAAQLAASELDGLAGSAKVGSVQHSPVVYAVFLGTTWITNRVFTNQYSTRYAIRDPFGPLVTPSDQAFVMQEDMAFLNTLPINPDNGILAQYRDRYGPAGQNPSLGAVAYDSSRPPAVVDSSSLGAIAAANVAAHGWPVNGNSQVMVFAPPQSQTPPKSAGYHTTAIINGQSIPVSVIGYQYQPSTSVASHEYSETVTDPQINAYYGPSNNSEVGDVCAWQERPGAPPPSPAPYSPTISIQKEWSQSTQSCR